MELGSQAWLDRCRERINGSDQFRDTASGWSCPLGLAFLDGTGEPVRHVVLRLDGGRCESADEVDAEAFAACPVTLSADFATWGRVLSDDLNLLKAIMLKRVKLDGDLLHIVKYATAVRALMDCVSEVEADVPATDGA